MSNTNEIEKLIEYFKKEKIDETINGINQRINRITQENKDEIEKIRSKISDDLYRLEKTINEEINKKFNETNQSNKRWFLGLLISLLVSIILGVASIIFS